MVENSQKTDAENEGRSKARVLVVLNMRKKKYSVKEIAEATDFAEGYVDHIITTKTVKDTLFIGKEQRIGMEKETTRLVLNIMHKKKWSVKETAEAVELKEEAVKNMIK
jgi:hypothetical protein